VWPFPCFPDSIGCCWRQLAIDHPCYDHENNLIQLLTRLFDEAEERGESDSGAMLRHVVVVVQDALLGLGVNGANDWLKAAERP
jgi:hypothetical protein